MQLNSQITEYIFTVKLTQFNKTHLQLSKRQIIKRNYKLNLPNMLITGFSLANFIQIIDILIKYLGSLIVTKITHLYLASLRTRTPVLQKCMTTYLISET